MLKKLVLGTDFSFQDVLNCYLPDSELRLWIKWSNRKAQVLKDMDRPGWCPEGRHWPPRFLSRWKDITLSEMRRWLVILIARGVLAPQVPTKDLWATGGFADYSKCRRLILRDRWVAISSVLCPYDPDETYEDPFDKIDPLLHRFSHRFTDLYDLGAEVSREAVCAVTSPHPKPPSSHEEELYHHRLSHRSHHLHQGRHESVSPG